MDDLTPGDLRKYPVWEFANEDEIGELVVRPVKRIPVPDLDGMLVGTTVRLANGKGVVALLGNVETRSRELTELFISVGVFNGSKRFMLARYFDPIADTNGPMALAKFLGLPIDEVFPIEYDLTAFASGDRKALVGRIEKKPRKKLPREEIIALTLARRR